jgi:hypothetical protein
MESSRAPAAATWGLLVAWAVHDAEELAAIPGWTERARPRLERRLPWVRPAVWDRLAAADDQVAVAVALMGVLVAAGAVDGARTGGRGRFYQASLAAFGAHAFGHLAASAVTGGYTPGVVTAPTVVLPFTWWARRALRRAGVPPAPVTPVALALIPVSIGAARIGAAALVRLRGRLR